MNINALMFWRKPASEPSPETSEAPSQPTSNVVHGSFGSRQPHVVDESEIPPVSPVSRRFKGLLEAPELMEFFALPHFGRGRALGASTRSFESMALGEAELVAEFQNLLRVLIQRREAKRQTLAQESASVEGISQEITAELKLVCKHLDEECGVLEEQARLAGESTGWVLEPLNSFRAGVHRGVREAIDFLLLSA